MIRIENKQNMTLYGEDALIESPMYLGVQKSTIRVRNGSSDITIDGIEIHQGYGYQSAYWCESVPNMTIENCSMEPPNASYGCCEFVRASYCNNLMVRNNTLDTWNSVSTYMSTFLAVGGSNVTITENTVIHFNNWTGYNIYQTKEGYVYFWGVSGGEISKNTFCEHHRSASSANYVRQIGIEIYGGSNTVVRNNLMYDSYFSCSGGGTSENWGILVDNGASGVDVYHNTIDRFGPTSSSNQQGTTYSIWVKNGSVDEFHSNIVTNTQAPSLATAYGVFSGSAVSLEYSDVWGVVGGTTGLYGGGASAGTGSISEDPQFVDPNNGDYHLDAGSPCIGTGKDGEDMGCYGGSDPLE